VSDYKDSLNLPQTSFPMKGRLPETEPKLLKRWLEMDLYGKILQKGRGRPMWVLHDGPPYANGHIHLGTALNKILKDIIIKSKTMSGFLSPYVPGWDCHGLPIENKVDKNLGPKKKEMSQSAIRRECRAYANQFVDIQREEFIRLGVLGDWSRPYLTMNYRYEAIIARELGQTALDGRLSRSVKPVLWCGSCRTALAEAEVEYHDHVSQSIFVPFRLLSDPALLSPRLAGKKVDLVIWTTTPWTIPANRGIAYNPKIVYGAFLAGDRVLLLARELAAASLAKFKIDSYEDLGDASHERMTGLLCEHPLTGQESKVVPALYVTLEQGTGLVHTAPGHGREDYETGKAHGLEVFSPLDDSARFTAEAPPYEGIPVLEANGRIIEDLKSRGRLLAQENLSHQYPHCWRCQKPVVFRATPQWFISMEAGELREKTLRDLDLVRWIPARDRERIRGMIANRPDWCVSRQRSWGVPITIFFCEKCGQWLYNEELRKRLFDLFVAAGADAWYETETASLLPPGQLCPHCGGAEFRKETDILDVWFDSGSSFAAVLEDQSDLPNQADMYLEGSDQHRGWFHSSLLVSEANRGRPPYREVLTHGYVVDGQGKKMSKSLGNTIEPGEIISQYGADVLRLWVASENYQDDIRVSKEILDMLVKAYFNFRNTARFILGNLFDFDPRKDAIPLSDARGPWEKYVLYRLNALIQEVRKAYESYAFHDVYHKVNNFMGLMSSFYLDILKDRLYTFKKDDRARREAQSVTLAVLKATVKLMAPILSFTAEEIWGYLPGEDGPESVFLADFPEASPAFGVSDLINDLDSLLALRPKVNKALEDARRAKLIGSSLDATITLKASGDAALLLSKYQSLLPEFFIASETLLSPADGDAEFSVEVSPNPHPKCPRCWNRHPGVHEGGVCPKCQKALA
jgi:isoleucyl-tRNA synthetase